MQNNTSQYVINIPSDDWHLALGVGLGLTVVVLLSVGFMSYRWYFTPVPLTEPTIIEMNNIVQSNCLSFLSDFLTANLAIQITTGYLLVFTLIIFSYARLKDNSLI